MISDPSRDFHPVVAAWFAQRFPHGPTPPQSAAWPRIALGNDVLVASPTGSGKTLTAFLVGINSFFDKPPASQPLGPSILYISPLRALATDIRHNLQAPLDELSALSREMGYDVPKVRVEVRTGDTSNYERQQHVKRPPHIYVTTPESLFLLLTSVQGRQVLRHVSTVIVDEIHSLISDKRGSHLSVSLERLERLVVETGGKRPQRIGLSATQRPLELVAGFLSGPHRVEACDIIDCATTRSVDFSIALPEADLQSVMATEQFDDVLAQICSLVATHRTTLVFVQSRRLAERLARELSDLLDERGLVADAATSVAAHHGSMSAERRHFVEAQLRAGALRALVATSTLELGIDVGPVDLVVQVGSPRTISAFLQRAGRANHQVGGTPAARLFPLNRHELVEAVALLDAVSRRELDVLQMPEAPLDVLMQQVVAEVALRGDDTPDALFAMLRSAWPYRNLSRETFDEALEFSSKGVFTGKGPKGQQLQLDPIEGVVRPRRSARLAALMNVGTIPDLGDYSVVCDPDNTFLGQVSEDFAIESSIGDVFLLGSQAWRIVKVEQSTVRVVDAQGAEPSIPVWFGESPARSLELSGAVSRIHQDLIEPLTLRDRDSAESRLLQIPGVGASAARQVVAFLSAAFEVLGDLPHQSLLIIERFFDDTGSTQLVVHSPFGARINRALGLALRKKFCVTFDFELQAAADDDAITIALGPHHSMPLDSVMSMVRTTTVRDTLVQAVLPLPMLATRWRWNGVRSLLISRTASGKRRPIQWLRMDADDLMAAIWPNLAACQENTPPGPIPVPDHPLVRQTIDDVLFEPLDIRGLMTLLERVEAGEVAVHTVETAEPSLLAQGILTGRPYTFLDEAPLEERRSRAVSGGRSPVIGGDGLAVKPTANALDPELIAEAVATSSPRIRDRHELADFLHTYLAIRPVPEWQAMFDELVSEGRALSVDDCWVSATRPTIVEELRDDDEAAAMLLSVHLDAAGPCQLAALVAPDVLGAGPLRGAPLSHARAKTALARLEGLGFAVALGNDLWSTRDMFQRLNMRARAKARRSLPSVSLDSYLNFLVHWQHLAPGSQLEGRDGVLEVISQLEGVEIAAGEWENEIFARRIVDYNPQWLDELCLSGEVAWARLTPKIVKTEDESRGSTTPSHSTPIAFCLSENLDDLLTSSRHRGGPTIPQHGPAAAVYELLDSKGAQFRATMPAQLGELDDHVNDGIWDLVARGLIRADSFHAVRALLGTQGRTPARRSAAGRARRGVHRAPSASGTGEGRFSLLPESRCELDRMTLEDLGELWASILVHRWGVVSFDIVERETTGISWLYISRALRRMEAQGVVVGGRFITGIRGEQYALREALELLVSAPRSDEVVVSACDPLNLSGMFVDSDRIAARPRTRVAIQGTSITPVS